MTLVLPPDLEQDVNRLVCSGDYPDAAAVLSDAIRVLVRERARHESLEEPPIDEEQMNELLLEAEASGDYTEMTAVDWTEIEREGLALSKSKKPA